MQIKIVDSIMGGCKSSAAINFMNTNSERKFLYVAPYLDETTRIKNRCPELDFQTILDDFQRITLINDELVYSPTKTAKLIENLTNRCNVAISHALFNLMDNSFSDLLHGYTLIIDEEPTVLEECKIKLSDKQILLDSERVKIDDNTKLVSWIDDTYTNNTGDKFTDTKRRLKSNRVFQVQNGSWLWIKDPALFDMFDDCYILTFRFESSICCQYFKKNNIAYTFYHVEGTDYITAEFSEGKRDLPPIKLGEINALFSVCHDSNLNAIGETQSSLSKNWFLNSKERDKKRLFNNAKRFFDGTSADLRMFSTFKDCFMDTNGNVKNYVSNGLRDSINFVPCNARASYDWENKTMLAYLLNIYPPSPIADYLQMNDLSKKKYALNMLLQWIYRSAIRKGKPISIYIPSKRMRELLEDWLQGRI